MDLEAGLTRAREVDDPRGGSRARVVLRIRDLAEAITDLQADFARAANLHITDLEAVTHLSEGPLTMGELGRRLSLTPGAITGLVDRLERAGHVQRTASEHDRRQTIVGLEPAAHRVIGAYFGDLAQRLLGVLETYSDDEVAVIERFLDELPGHLAPARSAPARSAPGHLAPARSAPPGAAPPSAAPDTGAPAADPPAGGPPRQAV